MAAGESPGLPGLVRAAFMGESEELGRSRMSRLIVVRATWDDEVNVWVAESPDLPGLITEAESLNALDAKLPGLIQDLLDCEDDNEPFEVPIEVIASYSKRLQVARPAAA
jgi:predicted RNase H-like HicB family nuclease